MGQLVTHRDRAMLTAKSNFGHHRECPALGSRTNLNQTNLLCKTRVVYLYAYRNTPLT